MRSASAAVAAALLWGLISDARGAAPEVRVEVTSSLPCANATSLTARVRARTPRARFEQGAELVARATFTQGSAGHVVGELVLAQPRHAAPARRVEADNCRDALDGIALILALSLDPAALTTADDSGAATPATAEATPSAEGKDATASSSPTAATPTAPDASQLPPPIEVVFDAEPSAAALAWHLRFAAAASGELALAPAPSPMYGAGLSLTLALESASVWSPSLTLGAQRLQSTKSDHAGGTASFSLDALTLELSRCESETNCWSYAAAPARSTGDCSRAVAIRSIRWQRWVFDSRPWAQLPPWCGGWRCRSSCRHGLLRV